MIRFSENSNAANNNPEKITPDIVAAGLVKRFTTAIPSSTSVINPSPTGISTPAIRKLSGTRNWRFCGCVYRSTNTAIPFSAKLQITPNA